MTDTERLAEAYQTIGAKDYHIKSLIAAIIRIKSTDDMAMVKAICDCTLDHYQEFVDYYNKFYGDFK